MYGSPAPPESASAPTELVRIRPDGVYRVISGCPDYTTRPYPILPRVRPWLVPVLKPKPVRRVQYVRAPIPIIVSHCHGSRSTVHGSRFSTPQDALLGSTSTSHRGPQALVTKFEVETRHDRRSTIERRTANRFSVFVAGTGT